MIRQNGSVPLCCLKGQGFIRKTKEAKQIFDTLKVNKNILLVVSELDENIILATRNLDNVTLLQDNEVNVLDIIAADSMIITEDAVKAIEEVLV